MPTVSMGKGRVARSLVEGYKRQRAALKCNRRLGALPVFHGCESRKLLVAEQAQVDELGGQIDSLRAIAIEGTELGLGYCQPGFLEGANLLDVEVRTLDPGAWRALRRLERTYSGQVRFIAVADPKAPELIGMPPREIIREYQRIVPSHANGADGIHYKILAPARLKVLARARIEELRSREPRRFRTKDPDSEFPVWFLPRQIDDYRVMLSHEGKVAKFSPGIMVLDERGQPTDELLEAATFINQENGLTHFNLIFNQMPLEKAQAIYELARALCTYPIPDFRVHQVDCPGTVADAVDGFREVVLAARGEPENFAVSLGWTPRLVEGPEFSRLRTTSQRQRLPPVLLEIGHVYIDDEEDYEVLSVVQALSPDFTRRPRALRAYQAGELLAKAAAAEARQTQPGEEPEIQLTFGTLLVDDTLLEAAFAVQLARGQPWDKGLQMYRLKQEIASLSVERQQALGIRLADFDDPEQVEFWCRAHINAVHDELLRCGMTNLAEIIERRLSVTPETDYMPAAEELIQGFVTGHLMQESSDLPFSPHPDRLNDAEIRPVLDKLGKQRKAINERLGKLRESNASPDNPTDASKLNVAQLQALLEEIHILERFLKSLGSIGYRGKDEAPFSPSCVLADATSEILGRRAGYLEVRIDPAPEDQQLAVNYVVALYEEYLRTEGLILPPRRVIVADPTEDGKFRIVAWSDDPETREFAEWMARVWGPEWASGPPVYLDILRKRERSITRAEELARIPVSDKPPTSNPKAKPPAQARNPQAKPPAQASNPQAKPPAQASNPQAKPPAQASNPQAKPPAEASDSQAKPPAEAPKTP